MILFPLCVIPYVAVSGHLPVRPFGIPCAVGAMFGTRRTGAPASTGFTEFADKRIHNSLDPLANSFVTLGARPSQHS